MPIDGHQRRTSGSGAFFDQRACVAAANNADLYEAVFSAHNLKYLRKPHVFVGIDRPPPYYSDITVLSAERSSDIVQEIISLAKKTDRGLGVKDSFCQLELEHHGFRVLFEASWIWRDAVGSTAATGWQKLETEEDLLLWEKSWKASGSPSEQRIFPAKILERTDLSFLGRKKYGVFTAGCIANTSPECVGISNVFTTDPAECVFGQAASAVARVGRSKPIVGYESGAMLQEARSTGFQPVGNLRILVADVAVY